VVKSLNAGGGGGGGQRKMTRHGDDRPRVAAS